MPRRSLLTVLVLNVVFSVAAAAEEPNIVPADRVIGRVYGRPVTAGDVGLMAPIDVDVKFDSTDQARWELMSRIQQVLGLPIQERFVREKKLVVTDDEIARFLATSKKQDERNRKQWTERLAAIAQELAAHNLPADKAVKLRHEQMMLEGFLKSPLPTANAEVARMFLRPWKIERELQRTYGGRIIFQQFGPEALDARRKLYEAAEAAGDLKFEEPGVRHLFYYYANMPHIVGNDEQALEKPWFFDSVE